MKYDKHYAVAVDFDNTITTNSTYYHTGNINAEAVDYIRKIKSLGCVIVLWTTREGDDLDEAIKMVEDNNIPIDFYNEYPYREPSRKVNVDFYIDDRSYPGYKIDWQEIYEFIEDKIKGGNYVLCK